MSQKFDLAGGDRLLSLDQCAELTGRKKSTWRKDVAERRVPVVRLGRLVRIPLSAVQALIRDGFTPAIR
jgi:excisionase family DNA binding protein